jgi:hypothetical protein
MFNRRGFLGGVTVGAAVAGVARLLKAPPPAPHDATLLVGTDVAPGARFGACTVDGVTKTHDGAIAVRMLDSDARVFHLELMAHDDGAPGVARAGELGVYVYNHGNGSKATNEEQGVAAMELARHLRERQAAGASMPRLASVGRRSTRAARA